MKKYLLLLAALLPSIAAAQTQVLIQKPTAKVYASPSAKSDVLVVLKKGSKVDVAGVTDAGWAKVKVTVSGFQFEGWVIKSALGGKAPVAAKPAAKAIVAAPAPRPTPQPTNTMKSSSSTQLEQFFEPSSPSSAPSPEPTPSQDVSARAEEFKAPREKKSNASSSSSSSSSGDKTWRSDKLILFASPGYMVHQYTFSDATKDAFRYNLTGLSVILGAEYKAFNFFDDLIRVGAVFQGQYVFLNTKTNLLDGTNTKFSDLTAANRMMDIWLKAKMMVNFERIVNKPFLVGLTFGYEYMKFFGDDIIADDGTPVGLFIDQSTKSLPVGILTELHFVDPVVMTIGADVLIKNSTSENPAGSSGTTPSAKMGFAPYLNLNFPLVGPHYMGIRYQYRIQKTNFAGPSSSRVNNTLNESSVLSTYHTIGLEYDYHF